MLDPVTHGVTAVAELKLDIAGLVNAEPRVTHGVTAVAELKPLLQQVCTSVVVASPTASPPWPN